MSDQPKPHVASNTPYVITGSIMTLLGAVGSLGIMLWRPDKDNTALLGSYNTVMVVLGTAVANLIKSHQTESMVNGQTHDYKEMMADLATARAEWARRDGELKGASDEQARVSALPVARTEAAVVAAAPGPAQQSPVPPCE